MQIQINRIDAIIKHPWFLAGATLFLIAGPFLALIGNAASDIWLSLIAIAFLFRSMIYRDWKWANDGWFLVAFIFWLWLVTTSLFSPWVLDSLEVSSVWIRFPVFAVAFAYFVKYSPFVQRATMAGFIAAIGIMIVVLIVERYHNMDAAKLFGTWNQHIKSGWYMIGYGLPISLWFMDKLDKKNSILLIISIFIIIFSTANTGDIYNTILLIFALSLLFVAQNIKNWIRAFLVFLAASVVTALGFFFVLGETLQQRFIHGFMVRLPWLPSSDYYAAWMGGIRAGFMEPIYGVGADNFAAFCLQKDVFPLLDIAVCHPHPHNIYIQVFAETGLIGLCLFGLMAVALFIKVLPLQEFGFYKKFFGWRMPAHKVVSKQAVVLIFVMFWPISTYSQAFGQHRNFFTWLNIGWALSLVQRPKVENSEKGIGT